MDDRAIWRAEQYNWKAKGITKPTGCPGYYTGCQCVECIERDEAEAKELAKEFKRCKGCGIPVEFCEPETCPLAETIKKAANIEEAAEEEYILITF